jgi:hypothetical protein
MYCTVHIIFCSYARKELQPLQYLETAVRVLKYAWGWGAILSIFAHISLNDGSSATHANPRAQPTSWILRLFLPTPQ